MSSKNWERCLDLILKHEGGYVNHPEDPGGMTNMGVTKKVYEEWIGNEVTEEDMQGLIREDVAPIYQKNYWLGVKAHDLPDGLDLCVFDWGVNSGPGTATKKLQEMVGADADGILGPNSLSSLNVYIEEHGLKQTIINYQAIRQQFYESLDTFSTFGNGWTRRVEDTSKAAMEMIAD